MATGSQPNKLDAASIAQQQLGINQQSIGQNQQQQNYNEITPYGSITYSYPGQAAGAQVSMPATSTGVAPAGGTSSPFGGGAGSGGMGGGSTTPGAPATAGSPTRTVTLDPAQQKLLDQQNALGATLNDFASNQIGNLPGLAVPTVKDYSTDKQAVIDSLLARQEPLMQADEQRWRTQLANQGLTPGSEAYNKELNLLGQRVNDARLQAILAGGQEQSRLVGLDLAQASAQNAARNQGFTESLGAASYGAPTMPQASAAPYQQAVSPPAMDQYLIEQYKADEARKQARREGLFGLGSTIIKGLFGLKK